MKIAIVAAMDLAGAIGRDNTIPWRLASDMRRFRALTMGKPIIMGRLTHASIGKALPGRTNLVLSRDEAYRPAEGCVLARSLDDALAQCRAMGAEEAMVVGGEALYREALPLADVVHLTLVLGLIEGADAYFPREFPRDAGAWVVETEAYVAQDAENLLPGVFLRFSRPSRAV